MPEYTNNNPQNVALNAPVLLSASIPCNRGNIIHDDGTGVFTLRGIVNNPSCCFARYQVTFNANISIPEGGDLTPIAVALSVQGEERPTSRAVFTPQAVDELGNVTSTAIITVPKGCCFGLAVRYVDATVADPATTPTPTINVQNANLVISRIS